MRLRLVTCFAVVAVPALALAQPKPTTPPAPVPPPPPAGPPVCQASHLVNPTLELRASRASSRTKVTLWPNDEGSSIMFSVEASSLTVRNAGMQPACATTTPTSIVLNVKLPRAYLANPANAGALALLLRCADAMSHVDGSPQPVSLTVSSLGLDKLGVANYGSAVFPIDSQQLRFLSCGS